MGQTTSTKTIFLKLVSYQTGPIGCAPADNSGNVTTLSVDVGYESGLTGGTLYVPSFCQIFHKLFVESVSWWEQLLGTWMETIGDVDVL